MHAAASVSGVVPQRIRRGDARRLRAAPARGGRAAGAVGLWLETVAEVIGNAALVHWDILRQDLGYTARMLRRAPGFAITAILIVALGIGATTAAFSVTDFVLLRPLPFPGARSARASCGRRRRRTAAWSCRAANYRDWKAAQHRRSSRMGAVPSAPRQPDRHRRAAAGRRHVGDGRSVPTLGVAAADRPPVHRRRRSRRRARHAASSATGSGRRSSAAIPAIVGRQVLLDDEPFTVIGVMPREFRFPASEVAVLDAAALQRAQMYVGSQRQLA